MNILAIVLGTLIFVKDVLVNVALICAAIFFTLLFGFGTVDLINEVYQHWWSKKAPRVAA